MKVDVVVEMWGGLITDVNVFTNHEDAQAYVREQLEKRGYTSLEQLYEETDLSKYDVRLIEDVEIQGPFEFEKWAGGQK